MDIVTVQNLKKTFGKGANKVEALRGIDLNVEKGSFTAIIAPPVPARRPCSI